MLNNRNLFTLSENEKEVYALIQATVIEKVNAIDNAILTVGGMLLIDLDYKKHLNFITAI